MPRPVYIVVAKDVVEDKSKSFVSIFSVLELLNMTVAPPRENVDPNLLAELNDAHRRATEFSAISVWMRENGDENVLFEHQFAMVFPDREDPVPAYPFQFSAQFAQIRFRLTIQGIRPLEESCTIYVDSRVRRLDTGDQWQQRYPIICNVQQPQQHPAPQEGNGHAI